MQVTLTVNGEPITTEVEPRTLLVHFLRDNLRLTGTHWGCDTSNCGTCVVDMDGEPVKSCTILAAMASGHSVRTVEGLEVDGQLDPVQEGFMQCHGLQCGFLALRALELARLSPLGEWHYKTASRDSYVDVSKAERVLDWHATKSNVDTLVENYDWYVANRARMQAAGVTHRVPWNQQALSWLKRVS